MSYNPLPVLLDLCDEMGFRSWMKSMTSAELSKNKNENYYSSPWHLCESVFIRDSKMNYGNLSDLELG